jgi:hypothetical protein
VEVEWEEVVWVVDKISQVHKPTQELKMMKQQLQEQSKSLLLQVEICQQEIWMKKQNFKRYWN